MKLVTGASGYIGRLLCKTLSEHGYDVKGIGRGTIAPLGVSNYGSCDLQSDPLDTLCVGVDTIVHLAGRAHVLKEDEAQPLLAFRRVNVDATLRLARQAMLDGVRRFIFISSIGVNTSETKSSRVSELSGSNPETPYALSKFEAEEALKELVKGSSMELVIVRPPLVYAGNAPGNFRRLLKLIRCGVPLPFLAVDNRRSMIALENLVDFITLCIVHPAAANELFLVSDGTDISTADIVRNIANGMGRSPYLVSVPVNLMRIGAKILRKEPMFSQLCGSLVIDSTKARKHLSWTPPLKIDEALFKAGSDYMELLSNKDRV